MPPLNLANLSQSASLAVSCCLLPLPRSAACALPPASCMSLPSIRAWRPMEQSPVISKKLQVTSSLCCALQGDAKQQCLRADFIGGCSAAVPGLRGNWCCLQGDAKEQVMEYLEAESIDLLMVGSAVSSRLRKALGGGGGVGSHLVHHAACPVLVLPVHTSSELTLLHAAARGCLHSSGRLCANLKWADPPVSCSGLMGGKAPEEHRAVAALACCAFQFRPVTYNAQGCLLLCLGANYQLPVLAVWL